VLPALHDEDSRAVGHQCDVVNDGNTERREDKASQSRAHDVLHASGYDA